MLKNAARGMAWWEREQEGGVDASCVSPADVMSQLLLNNTQRQRIQRSNSERGRYNRDTQINIIKNGRSPEKHKCGIQSVVKGEEDVQTSRTVPVAVVKPSLTSSFVPPCVSTAIRLLPVLDGRRYLIPSLW